MGGFELYEFSIGCRHFDESKLLATFSNPPDTSLRSVSMGGFELYEFSRPFG
jgi:hypothetical protein